MKIHNYDALTGEYSNTTDAAADPLDDGKFLIPAHSTIKRPGKNKKGYVQAFIDEKWILVEDHRGEIVYSIIDGSKIQVENLGVIDKNQTALVPNSSSEWKNNKWITNVKHLRNTKNHQISLEQERRISAGINIPSVGMFRADNASISRLHSLLDCARISDELGQRIDISFHTSAGDLVKLNSLQKVKELVFLVSEFVMNTLTISVELKESVEKMSVPKALKFDAAEEFERALINL